jgi:N-acetylglucosaminyldiphosphoundecaprenol N-acetyl-beta-D-mannosaminyltransferase
MNSTPHLKVEKLVYNLPDKLKADILGIKINNATLDSTIQSITQMVFTSLPHYIVPVNPEMIMLAQKDKIFKEILNQASLVLPDGIGVVIASRILGQPIKSRVTGVDTVKGLAYLAMQKRWTIFLLGAAPGVAENVKAKLEVEFPGIQILGTYAGSPDPNEEAIICNMVTSLHPHILLVAYGAPKQELWVARNLKRMNIPVVMCVGGTFDFIAGKLHRAPKWMQNLGHTGC